MQLSASPTKSASPHPVRVVHLVLVGVSSPDPAALRHPAGCSAAWSAARGRGRRGQLLRLAAHRIVGDSLIAGEAKIPLAALGEAEIVVRRAWRKDARRGAGSGLHGASAARPHSGRVTRISASPRRQRDLRLSGDQRVATIRMRSDRRSGHDGRGRGAADQAASSGRVPKGSGSGEGDAHQERDEPPRTGAVRRSS